MYSLAHLLRCGYQAGWTLRRIHILRFGVGHTHTKIDAVTLTLTLTLNMPLHVILILTLEPEH